VNCRVPVPTADVFRALGLRPGDSLPGPDPEPDLPRTQAGLLAYLARHGNDLEPPALAVAPAIAEVMDLLRAQPEVRLVRMSGSGATVFALTDNCRMAASVSRRIGELRGNWWVRPTILR